MKKRPTKNTTSEFQEFFEANRIWWSLPIQQNRVVERNNRTILDRVRCMLKSKRMPKEYMPKEFWAKAVATVVYMSNWAPTRNVLFKIPWQAWNGRKLSISLFLFLFSYSIACFYVSDEKRSKLYEKSKKLVFVGCDMNFKG